MLPGLGQRAAEITDGDSRSKEVGTIKLPPSSKLRNANLLVFFLKALLLRLQA